MRKKQEFLLLLMVLIILCAVVYPVAMKREREKQAEAKRPQTIAGHEPDAPVLDASKLKPMLEDVDPASIRPDNPGYMIDLDGDGVEDFVRMESGNILCWTKGPTNSHVAMPVLVIKGNLMAYNVTVRAGDKRPSVLFWNTDRKGFYQTCLGLTTAGVPFFGGLEEQ